MSRFVSLNKFLARLLPLLALPMQLSAFVPHYIFHEQAERAPVFTDSIGLVIDSGLRLGLEDILQLPESAFLPLSGTTTLTAPLVLWSSVRLSNAGSKRFDGYFKAFTFIDSLWVYTVKDGVLVDSIFSGNALSPADKHLSSNQNYLPFSLNPGETKTYYFKMRYDRIICSNSCMASLRVIPFNVLHKTEMMSHTLHSFYAGVMLCFGLVSIFMFFLFWEQVFLWFSLVTCSFVAYFISRFGLSELLFNHHPTATGSFDLAFIVSCIIVSATLFFNSYLGVQSKTPRLFRANMAVAVLIAASPNIGRLVTNDFQAIATIGDLLIIVWLIMLMGLVVYFVRRKDRSTIILLSSMIVLYCSAILYILGLAQMIPQSPWVNNAFQIGSMLFSGVLFYGMFDKINMIREEKRRFEELDRVKSRFFANISHEFRTPLTLVMGPIKDVLQKTQVPEDRNLLRLAYQNAARLLQLINQILDLSKLEANKMELRAQQQNFPAILKGIAMSFESLANRKNIQFNFVAQREDIALFVDKDKIEKIFYNLLSNAFKFTPENGEVAVMLSEYENRVEVLVRDSGQGIAPDRLPNIFNHFFQGEHENNHEQEGSGIGLALVKELVQLHGGEIKVESQPGIGTTFTISLLKGKAHLSRHDIITRTDELQKESALPPISTNQALENQPKTIELNPRLEEPGISAPTILIIEDNTAVRDYVRQHLISSFQVLEAINGQDGIEKALDLLPDLIISDVMMPKKDGYEVCATLKKDERTSHIPIILLTAKAAAEEKMKGLEIGADDYLVKPFDTKELEVRARNLIESRMMLRKKFSESEWIEPQAVGSNPLDQAFLEKICACISGHLSDEQFGVELLAQELGLSRSQVNRKITALTDQSTNKFIQSFRLQKAREMLQSGSGNVSEIAFRTGFNSTAYFVKCFKDKYGHTPGSLR